MTHTERDRERGLALQQRSIDSEKEIKAVVGRGRNGDRKRREATSEECIHANRQRERERGGKTAAGRKAQREEDAGKTR